MKNIRGASAARIVLMKFIDSRSSSFQQEALLSASNKLYNRTI